MSEDIRVVDNLVPPAEYESLAKFISSQTMQYGSRSNAKTDPHGHWSRKFIAAGRHNLADVSIALERSPNLAPLKQTWDFLRNHLPDNDALIRCYLNGYTYGVDGYFHRDSTRADELTAIVYVNDRWEPDWAGETTFLGEHQDILKSVLPKRNRAVIFPANMLHAGRGVSRKCTVLRKTLIYKTRKRRTPNFEKLSLFLRNVGAMRFEHQAGTLHDHLVRTFSLLETRGCEDSVCFGGGLHAIYGTNIFRRSIVTTEAKSLIAAEFGEAAEELANLFSILERPRTLDSPLALAEEEAVVESRDGLRLNLPRVKFDGLRKIECANLEDQNSLEKYKNLSKFWQES